MQDNLASWITLSGLIIPAVILILRSPDRSGHGLMMSVMTALLCFLGGFVLAGALLKLFGPFENPMIASVLVVIGALISVAGKEMLSRRPRSG